MPEKKIKLNKANQYVDVSGSDSHLKAGMLLCNVCFGGIGKYIIGKCCSFMPLTTLQIQKEQAVVM